ALVDESHAATSQFAGTMTARLRALAGPLEGAAFPLPQGEFTIGRSEANALNLAADEGTSRRHCVIHEQDQRFTLRDLSSHNSTYVNDVAVHEHRLEHGDEIGIGHSLFVFLEDGQPSPSPRTTVDLDDGQPIDGRTISLRRTDALDLQPQKLVE